MCIKKGKALTWKTAGESIHLSFRAETGYELIGQEQMKGEISE